MKVTSSANSNLYGSRGTAMDKAKQLKDERKYNLAKAGEMAMASGSNINRITSSELANRNLHNNMASEYMYQKPATMKYGASLMDQNPSESEMNQAGSALRLLKSKMTNNMYGGNNYDKSSDRQQGYFDDDTHEYHKYGPGPKKLDQDRDLNSMYHNNSQNNYGKVFKPTFNNDEYSRDNGSYNNRDYVDSKIQKKTQQLNRVNDYGRNDDYNYPVNTKPPLGNMSKGNNYGSQQPNQNYSDFNAPSRIPQKNNTAINSKPKINPNFYDDDYNNRNARGASEERNSYGNNQYGGYNNQPKNQGAYSTKNADNKGSNLINHNRNQPSRDEEYAKTFSKPAFAKNATTPKGNMPTATSASTVDEMPLKGASSTKNAFEIGVEENEYDDDAGPLRECPQGCGRSFNPKALAKHAKICKKVFQTKRKEFDSSKARETDEQAELANENRYGGKRGGKPPAAANKKPAAAAAKGGKAKWKAESESFRANLKAARGGPLTQEEQAATKSDHGMVACDFCGRKFNEQAAARHIPFCQTKSKINDIKKGPIKGKR